MMSIIEIVESSLKEYHKEHLKDKLSVDEIYDIAKKYNFKIKDNIEKKSVILTDYCYNLVNKLHFETKNPCVRKIIPAPFLLSVKFHLKNLYSTPSELEKFDKYYLYVGLDYMYSGPVWKLDKSRNNAKNDLYDGYYVCGEYKNGKFYSLDETSGFEIIPKQDSHKDNEPRIKESETLVEILQRLGQQQFREKLLNFWNNTCPLSGITQLEVLRASHIKPWAQSDNSERMNHYNGLLLSANYDALFDRGLISFDENGKILISNEINDSDRAKLGLSLNIKLNNKYCKHHDEFMKYHRSYIFKN